MAAALGSPSKDCAVVWNELPKLSMPLPRAAAMPVFLGGSASSINQLLSTR